MTGHAEWKSLFLATAAIVALAAPVFLGFTTVPRLQARAPSAQSPAAPQWQIDAGGKMSFDVASVKRNKSGPQPSPIFRSASGDFPHSNVFLGPGEAYVPTGGLFAGTNLSLGDYMSFAFKITGNQGVLLRPQLPKWAITDLFDIQARVEGNPTKDQMRLMMQSLLADRFKLAIHFETRQLPVFALVVDKTGKLGPQLQPHSGDSMCPPPPSPGSVPPPTRVEDRFPTEVCGDIIGMPATATGRYRVGARNVPIALIENTLAGLGYGNLAGNLGRPVLGQTGLTGTFDFSFEFTPQLSMPPPSPGATAGPESGSTFQEALKEQLGLKLLPGTGPVDVIVIDHVEEPSPN
jgi:uncharacterized protein (TIGR03435 family)